MKALFFSLIKLLKEITVHVIKAFFGFAKNCFGKPK